MSVDWLLESDAIRGLNKRVGELEDELASEEMMHREAREDYVRLGSILCAMAFERGRLTEEWANAMDTGRTLMESAGDEIEGNHMRLGLFVVLPREE